MALLACSCCAFGQRDIYADYPQRRGKVQPLEWKELPGWLTLDAEVRGRTEGQTSYNDVSGNVRLYELTRLHGGLTVRPAKFLTGYVQFHDNHALGLPTHIVAANMRDAFDLRQGYLDLRSGGVRLIAGRQELKFGSERLIGISDWTNNSRTFDGFDLRVGDKNQLDVFSASVVTVHPTAHDDHGGGLMYHGAYGSITTWIPKVHLQPFVLIKAIKKVTCLESVPGSQLAVTFGAETEGKVAENWSYEVNGALQRGSYSSDSIHAGEGFAKVGYFMSRVPWTPRVGGEIDYATGNDRSGPLRYGTFDQQYPSNHNAFGLVDLLGYQNIRQERINLDLRPTAATTVLIQGGVLNVATTRDSVYASSGSVLVRAPGAGFASSKIGAEFDASAKYVFRDYVVLNVGLGHLFPGELMTANGHGAGVTSGYLSLTYRFKVDRQAVP